MQQSTAAALLQLMHDACRRVDNVFWVEEGGPPAPPASPPHGHKVVPVLHESLLDDEHYAFQQFIVALVATAALAA